MIKTKLAAKQIDKLHSMHKKLPATCSECPFLEASANNYIGITAYHCSLREGDDIIPGARYAQRHRCNDCPLADKCYYDFKD